MYLLQKPGDVTFQSILPSGLCTSATTICYRYDLVLAEHDMSGDQIGHSPGIFGLGSEMDKSPHAHICLQET